MTTPGYSYSRIPREDGGESVNGQTTTHRGGEEASFKKRRDFCLAFTVLLAIVYVLARAGHVEKTSSLRSEPVMAPSPSTTITYTAPASSSSPAHAPSNNAGAVFDIDSYRADRLSHTPPHIIECLEAGEGGSQEVCHLPRPKRFAALDQKGVTLWMTGLSGSGKSTIATALEEKLVLEFGKHVYRLDGDNIRTGLNRDLGFSKGDRAESVRRVGELACLFSDAGVVTVVSLVSPYRDDRDAVRRRHEEQGIKFLEVFMDVDLSVVQERDPKGLYEKVAKGELKGFTGVDDPYEAPTHAEIVLPNSRMTVEECVDAIMRKLRQEGVLVGGAYDESGMPMPDGGEIIDLHVSSHDRQKKLDEARSLPKALLTDIDVNWLQTVAEGYAAPLRGFMREGVLMQTLHFNSIAADPYNITGAGDIVTTQTDWNEARRPPQRMSMSVPIVLPTSDFTKQEIENSGKNAVALVNKHGEILAILRNPEIYEHRKEEIVTRTFGAIDRGHPYIAHIYASGPWLIGGEIEVIDRIKYHDGLDKYRLSAKELYAEFKKKGADTVFAFQTRNPTHAGHAYLMKTAREKLLAQGYKNPVLWLSPLGGWTKSDDVPLDVRVLQHEAVLREGMLDPATTVMAIWPGPMIYAGPTEVQFHAKSRRNAGASYFVVGRDPAGMKGSDVAEAHPDDDLYNGDHGKYILQLSPGMGEMGLVSFSKVYYDKKTHTMRDMDEDREDDFISISGSKMRALARQGAKPCPPTIPSDLLQANCIPPGFMVNSGWDIVCDYYQHVNDKTWVAYSTQKGRILVDDHARASGDYGTLDFGVALTASSTGGIEGAASGGLASPWHDVPLMNVDGRHYNFVTEIPMFGTAKLEVMKDKTHNPIMQDEKNGQPRYYKYGVPFFNYGMFPQTWEDPEDIIGGYGGDNDPLDAIEVGEGPLPVGSVTGVKVLGSIELIDEGEMDNKVIVLRNTDPIVHDVNSVEDLERHRPGLTARVIDWMKNYKTAEGKGVNKLTSEIPTSADEAKNTISHMHDNWKLLKEGKKVVKEFAM